MAEGRFATEKLTQQHDDYLAQLYDLNQLHVDIPLNDQTKGTLVFKKKTVSIDRQKINDLNQLAEAIQINWEIDLEKSTLPVAYILPRQTLHLNDAQDTN